MNTPSASVGLQVSSQHLTYYSPLRPVIRPSAPPPLVTAQTDDIWINFAIRTLDIAAPQASAQRVSYILRISSISHPNARPGASVMLLSGDHVTCTIMHDPDVTSLWLTVDRDGTRMWDSSVQTDSRCPALFPQVHSLLTTSQIWQVFELVEIRLNELSFFVPHGR